MTKSYKITIVKRTGNKYKSHTFTGLAWNTLRELTSYLNKTKFNNHLDYFYGESADNIIRLFCTVHYKDFILKKYFKQTVESIEIVDIETEEIMVKFNPRYISIPNNTFTNLINRK